MKYISRDRLDLVKQAVRRGTDNCAELLSGTGAEQWGEEKKTPLKFNVRFSSSGDMTTNEVRLFSSQLVALTLIADELTAFGFQTSCDDDPELTNKEAYEKAGNELQAAIKNCESIKVVTYILAGIIKEA